MRLARALFFLNGVIWLVFAFRTFTEPSSSSFLDLLDDTYRPVISAFMALNAALMFAAVLLLKVRRRLVWLLAMAVLAVNIALTFTDEVGFADWATVAVDVVIVGLLVGARAWFAPARHG